MRNRKGVAPAPAFDRDIPLAELLLPLDHERLRAALEGLLGTSVRLMDEEGRHVLGDPGRWRGSRVPVGNALEPFGALEAQCEAAALAPAADLLAQLLEGVRRYHMTAHLHVDTVQEDFRVLQDKLRELAASEARYRELNAQLEGRVAAQVATIEAAHRQLYQAEKLASVGQLAAGVAHEVNNPIGFIRSNLRTAQGYLATARAFADLLRDDAGADPRAAWRDADLDFVVRDLEDLLGESLDGADRVARIVADLKGFARVDGVGDEPVDVNELLKRVGDMAAPLVRDRVDTVYRLSDGLPPVTCDPARLGQVFLNLLQNAAQAMEGRGRVELATSVREGRVCVRVTDTGPGIPADVLPRIFEPFFTTREVGAGTGLGLTVCADTVRAYGGRIEVQSEPGRGTTFSVYLPSG